MRMELVGRLGNHWTRMYSEFQVNRSWVEASWITVLGAQLCPTLCNLRTIAHQVLLSMGFFRQEYWVAISSSRGSSWPRNRTHVSCVSCIASKFFNHWAIVQTKKDSIRLSKDRCLLRTESAVRGAPCLTEWSYYAPPLVRSSLSENTAGVQMWQLFQSPAAGSLPSSSLNLEVREAHSTATLPWKTDCLLAIINSFNPWISK